MCLMLIVRQVRLVLIISACLLVTGAVASAQNDVTPINAIQGAGDESPLADETVRIRGIVTADYQGNLQLGGFFVQEESSDTDSNPQTSEGIFVYCDPDGTYSFRSNEADVPRPRLCTDNAAVDDVAVGDLVEIEGVVVERFGQTQITAAGGSVTVLSQNNPLPDPVVLNLSADLIAPGIDPDAFYEPYEGMLVTIADTLTVSEYFQLSRFGQIVLYQGGRPHQYTHLDDTPTTAESQAYAAELERRRLILDDDSDVENLPLVRDPQIIFYPQPGGLSTTNFFRGGDTITGLTGILSYGFNAWRIRPAESALMVFTPANPRPTGAPQVGGSLKVASFNVLNYFTTLNSRGANSMAEFDRQADKIVAALAAIDADIVGLMEIENSPNAIADLVDRLNDALGAGTYDFIDTGVIGTDEITVALIYKPGTVTPVGTTAVLDDEEFTNPRGTGVPKNRPAVAQTFRENASDETLTVVVNHLKSKGSACGTGDDDPIQGNCNASRAEAAAELVRWLETDPTGTDDQDILIIGDLNSYAGEDPIDAIRAGGGSFGYTDLQGGVGSALYTYVFDGQLGYLDYALASDSLLPQVVETVVWHINADEIPDFDYNDDILDAAEAEFNERPDGNPLYEPLPYRASDHDPVIVGLNLQGGTGGPRGTGDDDLPDNVSVDVSGTGDDVQVTVCVDAEDAEPVTVTVTIEGVTIEVVYGANAEQCGAAGDE